MNAKPDHSTKRPLSLRRPVLALVLVAAAFLVGRLTAPQPPPASQAEAHEHAEEKATIWTCSMHPQIRLPAPGKCPICFMDLIPLKAAAQDEGPRTLVLSQAARELAEIQTSPVERKFVTAQVRMVGKVDYDESRVAELTAYVGGRLDRLFVDYTGIPVRKGDHMVYLYSPEIYAAQEELLQAIAATKRVEGSQSQFVRETADATVKAAREKLRLLGLTPVQVKEIETRGTASDHITIYAPIGGIVIRKDAFEGSYVQTGTRIYQIANLTEVWVKLDAYETDLPWLRYGQKVTFAAEAYPGQTFTGTIAFIDPVLNAMTRTVKVRVNVPNAAGELKPEMFVRATVQARVAAGGRVMDPDLSGKWICPMHPSVVRDAAADCPVCGMPLVRTESLGYVAVTEQEAARPLVIPASAPLVTGTRAVVYVEKPGAERPTYEGREITLGPRVGDFYLVAAGLREGERVVTRGNFKIDSALQIVAKPSMMSSESPANPPAGSQPAGGSVRAPEAHTSAAAPAPPKAPIPAAFQAQIGKVADAYLALTAALAKDDLKAATQAVGPLRAALDAVDMKLLDGDAHHAWMKELPNLRKPVEAMAAAKDLQALRTALALLSEALPPVVKTFGLAPRRPLYRVHCPMAFQNRGADWLQKDKAVLNPYFGAGMLHCGEVVEELP